MILGKFSRYWILQAAGWGSFALINTFFAYSFGTLKDWHSTETFFGRLSIYLAVGLVATIIMRFLIRISNVLQKSVEQQAAQFLLMTVCFSFVASFTYMSSLNGLNLLSEKELFYLKKNVFLLILDGAFGYFWLFFIWNLIYFMFHYVTKSRKQQMETLQLETLVKELELKTIKAHINPHFIFNALNSIRALIDENPVRARTAVTELSNILRSSLKAEKGETVPLNDELQIVKDYLALEHIRFEDRLQVEYKVDSETLKYEVPPMMLQTLVENAIKHGISKQVRGGLVRIASDRHEGFYELTVQNTGHLTRVPAKGGGFGLSSTQDRLALLYGEKARFQIRQISDDLVEARVEIPV
ncbi:MAG: sensor histidine kinase [Chitinophagaceae bacterium]|nr:MAG: sensor histidine kinase [Chitinophagaceae bacterium]